MLSVSPATSPLRRSYAKLAKICYKDKNALHSTKIEIFCLLDVLQIEFIEFIKYEKSLKMKETAEYLVTCKLALV